MGRVRQKGTAPEAAVGALLRSQGLAYRKNVRSLPGSPDYANRKGRWAVFVNGCFWHQHTGCRRATVPKANHDYWTAKFADNRSRDAKSIRALRRAGFRVTIVWECEAANAGPKLLKLAESRRIGMRQAVDHGGVVVDVTGLRRGRCLDELHR